MSSILDRVFSGDEWIAVYGTGYVGLALIAVYLRKGLKVIGVDIDRERLEMVREGRLWFSEKPIEEAVREGVRTGRLVLTIDGVEASRKSIVKVVTVPVYIDWGLKKISYRAITDAVEKIGLGLKENDLVIIESSVPPGTTREIVKPVLEEKSGLVADRDFYLAYSPERIYIGRAVEDIEKRYPKVIGGIGPNSLEVASRFYERIVEKGVIRLSCCEAAEFEKLAEGIYRDVNIALANELALACMKLGIDFYEVRRAANSQPFCHIHLPGPGVGGYCIPLYPYFAMDRLLVRGYVMELTRLARRINEYMPMIVVNIIDNLREKYGLEPSRAKTAILGLAFRGDISDTRLSPTYDIVGLLIARGYRDIVVHDPYVPGDQRLSEMGVKLTSDLSDALERADIVVVCTRHRMYRGMKLSSIIDMAGSEPVVVDTIGYIDVDTSYEKIFVLGKTPL